MIQSGIFLLKAYFYIQCKQWRSKELSEKGFEAGAQREIGNKYNTIETTMMRKTQKPMERTSALAKINLRSLVSLRIPGFIRS